MEEKITRGQRNCNPLNIRRTNDTWMGMSAMQNDKEFITFKSLKYGIRAAIKLIRRYIILFSCNSIRKIISRWAPPSENNTSSYIKFVSERTGYSPDEVVDAEDRQKIADIISAMAYYESRMKVFPAYIIDIWSLFL